MRACDVHAFIHGSTRRAVTRLAQFDLTDPSKPPTVLEVCDMCDAALKGFLNETFGLDKLAREFVPDEKREGEEVPSFDG